MIADLKPYPTYKDSGVGWLGEVPEGWSAVSLRQVGRFFKGSGGSKEDEVSEGIPCVRYGDLYSFHGFHIDETRSFVAADRADDYASVQAGDVLFAASGETLDEIGKSAAVRMDGPVCAGGDLVILRPTIDVDPTFMGYACGSSPSVWQKARMGKGVTVMHIHPHGLRNLQLVVPPVEEQVEIGEFLDRLSGATDDSIQKQRRLIELVEEEKQAVIHRAVTRGLDPDVRLKPSGVDWLGDVPEHWEVVDLGRVTEVLAGYAFSSRDFSSDPTDPRLLRGVNIAPDAVRWDETVRWPRERVASVDRYILCQGDIVLGLDRPIVGSGLRVARVREADLPALLLQRVARLRTTTRLDADFAFQFLRGPSFMRYIEPILTGISVPHLSPDQLRRFKIALPPPEEQKRIMRWLEERLQSSEAVTPRSRRQIDLLDELRTRLIADVVTGKLDVREAAAGLSDDPDAEPAAVDRLRESVSA